MKLSDGLKWFIASTWGPLVLALGGGLGALVSDNVWTALWIAAPVVLVQLVPKWRVRIDELALPGKRLGVVLGAYALLLVVLVGLPTLDRGEAVAGYAPPTRDWLGTDALGNWRYTLAPNVPPTREVVVLLLPREPLQPPAVMPGDSELEDLGLSQAEYRRMAGRRLDLGSAIQEANRRRCTGIALDVELSRPIREVDPAICVTVHAVRLEKIPIYVGYGWRTTDSGVRKIDAAPSLFLTPAEEAEATPGEASSQGCFRAEDEGHLMAFRGGDGHVRHLPLYFEGPLKKRLPALSLRVAQHLATQNKFDLDLPEDGLLWLLPPARDDVEVVRFTKIPDPFELPDPDDPAAAGDAAAAMADRFVIVGEDSPEDSFETEWGTRPGAMLHATAACALLNGHFIRRAPDWAAYVAIALLCGVLYIRILRGDGLGSVLLTAACMFATMIVVSALAMHFSLVWIDNLPTIPAVLLFVPLAHFAHRPGS